MKPAIAPDTTIAEVLAGWPELEQEIVAAAPSLEQLKNPVLREAVARSATVSSVAALAGIPASELVNRLRSAAGLETPEAGADTGGVPDWATAATVRFQIDADEMLSRGVHPVGAVREYAAQLQPGEVMQLKSGFRPQPLIELMQRGGLEVWCSETEPGRFLTVFKHCD